MVWFPDTYASLSLNELRVAEFVEKWKSAAWIIQPIRIIHRFYAEYVVKIRFVIEIQMDLLWTKIISMSNASLQ